MRKELFNKKNKEDLKLDLKNEVFDRVTISFYKYINLTNLEDLRDQLYVKWRELNVLGRVYIADEGINAQLSVPENKLNFFIDEVKSHKKFKEIFIKQAIVEGDSFYKCVRISIY